MKLGHHQEVEPVEYLQWKCNFGQDFFQHEDKSSEHFNWFGFSLSFIVFHPFPSFASWIVCIQMFPSCYPPVVLYQLASLQLDHVLRFMLPIWVGVKSMDPLRCRSSTYRCSSTVHSQRWWQLSVVSRQLPAGSDGNCTPMTAFWRSACLIMETLLRQGLSTVCSLEGTWRRVWEWGKRDIFWLDVSPPQPLRVSWGSPVLHL